MTIMIVLKDVIPLVKLSFGITNVIENVILKYVILMEETANNIVLQDVLKYGRGIMNVIINVSMNNVVMIKVTVVNALQTVIKVS